MFLQIHMLCSLLATLPQVWKSARDTTAPTAASGSLRAASHTPTRRAPVSQQTPEEHVIHHWEYLVYDLFVKYIFSKRQNTPLHLARQLDYHQSGIWGFIVNNSLPGETLATRGSVGQSDWPHRAWKWTICAWLSLSHNLASQLSHYNSSWSTSGLPGALQQSSGASTVDPSSVWPVITQIYPWICLS